MKSFNSCFYSFACFLIGIFARIVFRLHIIGHENIPRAGGIIVASNHLSYLDIPLLAYSIGRDADYMAKKELFSIPGLGLLIRTLGAFPVDRERLDRSTIREAIKRLKSGKVLVIYPEGTRSPNGRLQPAKPGVGMIVRMTGATVVPVAVTGTDNALPRGSWMIRRAHITIEFGKPLDFSSMIENTGEKGDIEKITKIIMENISSLINSQRSLE